MELDATQLVTYRLFVIRQLDVSHKLQDHMINASSGCRLVHTRYKANRFFFVVHTNVLVATSVTYPSHLSGTTQSPSETLPQKEIDDEVYR